MARRKRQYYERLFAKYPDVVTLVEFRQMLGGISEKIALRLVQQGRVYHFMIRRGYRIPKDSVIEFVMSDYYDEIRDTLKHQV